MPLPTARLAVTSKVATLCPSLLLSDPKLIGSAHVHVCFSSTITCPGRSPTSMLYLGSGLSHFSVPLTFVCPLTLIAASSAKHPANNTRAFINPPPAIKSFFNRLAMGNYRRPKIKRADNETSIHRKSNVVSPDAAKGFWMPRPRRTQEPTPKIEMEPSLSKVAVTCSNGILRRARSRQLGNNESIERAN